MIRCVNCALIFLRISGKLNMEKPSETMQRMSWRFSHLRFESRVVLDGSQTMSPIFSPQSEFESRVVLDGSQTHLPKRLFRVAFESRVVLDGSQTGRYTRAWLTVFESRVVLDGSQTGRAE